MDIQALKRRLSNVDPLVADTAMAVGLAVAVCLQIFLITHFKPPELPLPADSRMLRARGMRDYGVVPYALAAVGFLALSLRRKVPWLALLLSASAALLYEVHPSPPAFTTLAPMLALYSTAAYSQRRHMGLIALLVAGMVVAVPVFALTGDVRWIAQTVGTFALLAAAALLGDTARSRREYIAEVESRALDAEHNREEEALRRVDEERMRIAREVHDIVAHSLSIVTVQAAAADAVFDSNPAQARESIRNVRLTGRQALSELRSMLDLLRTGDSDVPLTPAADLSHLDQLITPVRDAGISVDLSTHGDLKSVPAFASVSAYRIVQEALTNIVRHSGADRASVSVSANGDLALEITDNGRGATAEALASGGHGLSGMSERVDALGGKFSAAADPSGGFRVRARIPLTRSV